ncbi:MAG: UDP-N-acetylglucosamine--N-acetylmuramyl-(pentapeptide) pyrophosphoryl-undecaprenol N-acetylglucosamine transferase, partial [Muribaculaceae bacterium]|nr:UDP-N-acetylglucosamine--N-acetylmuramyl-(pentapeptide) pyrophosphoryl-undecaprenol N-acetylglucosamine transferase [Muribaculaceae bacterium]
MKNDNKAGRQARALRVLISGGGTGGHIFPALSIADAVEREFPGAEILFVGAENRMEMQRVPAAGYDIVGLPVCGFDRNRLWRNFGVLVKLFKSMRMARRIVRDFKPDVAVGVGGYASGPTLKAAQRAGVPTVIQEQNSYAGVTNKLLASRADRICVAYPGMEKFFPAEKIVMTGNPVRKAILEPGMTRQEAKAKLGFDPDMPLVLVVGGSLGARTLNNAMLKAIDSGEAAKVSFGIMWQCGSRDRARCEEAVRDTLPDNVRLSEFISDMATAYCAADLVVSRAGAGTISALEL